MTQTFEKIGMVSSASVQKGTGKSWDQWVQVLDRAGARSWTHQEIVAFLKKKHRLTPWWQQGVTSGYEVAIGRREQGRNQKGEFSVTCTKVFPIGAKAGWKLLNSPEGLACWLKPLSDFSLKPKEVFESEGGVFGEVRTMKAGERARLRWQDTDWPKATVVQLGVYARPGEKCILVFQHDGFADIRTRERMRAYWKEALAALLDLASSKQKPTKRKRS